MQGAEFEGVAEALRNGDLDAAGLPPRERLLLEFVGTISRAAYRVTDEQVQGLRDMGWTDEQIAEAAYDAALFSLFVRLADTFGIEPPAAYEPNAAHLRAQLLCCSLTNRFDALAALLVASPGSGPPESPNLSSRVFGRATTAREPGRCSRQRSARGRR